ncbi:MAG: IclR family transcriptional regulator [Sporosarcina sp.]
MLKTVNLALEVLKMFTREKPVWGGRELAHEMELNHTNIYRILETLERNGFVTKDPITKQYSLGSVVWELGTIFYEGLNISKLINPILEKLSERTGESVFLTILDKGEAVTLIVIEPKNKVKFSVSAGSRAPLYVGASYRSILAYMPEESREKVITGELVKYTERTMTDPTDLRNELSLIRKNGWTESQGEYTPDVVAIAVPLLVDQTVIGSITVAGPSYRMEDEQKKAALPLLYETRNEVVEVITRYNLKLNA